MQKDSREIPGGGRVEKREAPPPTSPEKTHLETQKGDRGRADVRALTGNPWKDHKKGHAPAFRKRDSAVGGTH